MGMFDYVTIAGKEFQSKDTPDQFLSHYRVVNGRLMRRVIDKADVDQNWHGYLYLTAGQDEGYTTYRAKFTDGTLIEIEKMEPLTPASSDDV